MALPIRDGNQSLTTLSTIIVNSAHVPAHSVVSLGSQAITDIAQAVSGVELGPNTISALENISVTFGAGTSVTIGNVVSVTGGLTNSELRASSVTIGGSVQVSNFPATQSVTFSNPTITGSVSVLNLPSTQTIAGTVTANISGDVVYTTDPNGLISLKTAIYAQDSSLELQPVGANNPLPISGTVTANGGNFLNADNALITKDSASNIILVGGLNYSATPTQSAIDAIRTDGSGAVVVYSSQTNWTDTNAGNQARSASQQTPFPVQILGGSVTIGSIPAISGTVTVGGFSTVCVGGTGEILSGVVRGGLVTPLQVDQTTGYLPVIPQVVTASGMAAISPTNPVPVTGAVTVTIGAIGGAVTIPVRLFAEREGAAPTGEDTLLQCNSSGALLVDLRAGGESAIGYDGDAFLQVKQVAGSSVTIASLPAISGTVTVGGFSGVSVGSGALLVGGLRGSSVVGLPLDSASGNVSVQLRQTATTSNEPISQSNPLWVTQQGSITIGSIPAISGTVTANTAYATSITGFAGGAGSVTALPVVISDKGIYGGNFLGYNGSNTFLNVGIASVGQASLSTSTNLPVSGTITVGNSVTISSLPSISGTVTANTNLPNFDALTFSGATLVTDVTVSFASGQVLWAGTSANQSTTLSPAGVKGRAFLVRFFNDGASGASLQGQFFGEGTLTGAFNNNNPSFRVEPAARGWNNAPIAVLADNVSTYYLFVAGLKSASEATGATHEILPFDLNFGVYTTSGTGFGRIAIYKINVPPELALNSVIHGNLKSWLLSPTATVTVGNSITVSSLPAITGSVSISGVSTTLGYTMTGTAVTSVPVIIMENSSGLIGTIDGTISVGNSVTIASLPAISGTVTAAISNAITISSNPSGSITTRFGSTTTAGVSQLTSAVTNTSRKYLLIQNPSIATVTVGIGFAPTSTQGITLGYNGGIMFDSFVPTGAVYWLSGVTGANFNILEG